LGGNPMIWRGLLGGRRLKVDEALATWPLLRSLDAPFSLLRHPNILSSHTIENTFPHHSLHLVPMFLPNLIAHRRCFRTLSWPE
jgi:hypothetical protein